VFIDQSCRGSRYTIDSYHSAVFTVSNPLNSDLLQVATRFVVFMILFERARAFSLFATGSLSSVQTRRNRFRTSQKSVSGVNWPV